MPDTSSDAFLQGQGVPVALPDIEAELTRLWGPAAEQVGGPDLEHPAVTRVVLANLVVACRCADDATIGGVLDALASSYPCRTIVLRPTADPERRVLAEVSALCHLPALGLPQVCSERITLSAGPTARDLLPGAVRPLLEADLPCILWWADAADAADPLLRGLAGDITRLLLDPPDPVDPAALRATLDPTRHPYARDIAWFGLPRWRGLVSGLFDPPGVADVLRQIDAVEVRAVATASDHTPRVAAWLAAWLAGQLGWEPQTRESTRPGAIAATFRGPSGPITVRLATEVDPTASPHHLVGVTLTAGAVRFRVERPVRDGAELRVEASGPGLPDQSRTVVAPELDAARRVAAALESTRDDPPFRAALPHALWLMGA